MTVPHIVVRQLSEVDGVECPCGTSHRLLMYDDLVDIGLHVTDMGGAQRHYHERTTEVYYVIEGEGRLEVGERVVDVKPGHAVYIPPKVPHRAIGEFRAVIVTVPPFDPSDEHPA